MERFRSIPTLCTAVLGLVLVRLVFGVDAPDARRPNILFILTDDQGWPTLGCYGNKLVPTPHLDRLAREGVRFTDAYVMPQCTPTRAALLTGQHTARTRMWHVIANPWYGYPWAPVEEPPFREALPSESFNLPKGLRQAGYATGMAGKWHLTANNDGHYTSLREHAADKYGFDFVAPPGPGSQNEGDKWVDHLTDHAIDFIRRHREQSWFFYLAHHTLHGRVSAPESLIKKHLAMGAPADGLHNATYLAAIEHLDKSIGRLMQALDDLELSKSTLIVFLSDNGGVSQQFDPTPFTEGPGTDTILHVAKEEFSNAPLRGPKGSIYEGGIRVPCIVRWPGVARENAVESTPIHVVDWLPTLLDAAGATAPDDHTVDGVSLLPLLRGEVLPDRALFWHAPLYDLRWGATPSAVIRRGDWKLIEYFGDRFDVRGNYVPGRHVDLFNLRDDLAETTNLANEQPHRRDQLLGELHELIAGCNCGLPGPNPHHDRSGPLKETKVKPDFLQSP